MALPAGWHDALRRPHRRVMLCTILPTSIAVTDPTLANVLDLPHPALQPGAVNLATTDQVHILDERTGRVIPFKPYLQAWPTTTMTLARQDRRVTIADASVTILPDAKVAGTLIDLGGGQVAYGWLGLWTDGLTLQQAYTRLAGPVQSPAQNERRTGPITLDISDGPVQASQSYPANALDREAFPNMPESVVGTASRQVILGQMPRRVLCVPISQDGTQFYVCEMDITRLPSKPPTQVFKGDSAITSGWHFVGVHAQPTDYTMLVFDENTKQIPEIGEISCSGGIGYDNKNPIQFLLDYGGYIVAPEAKPLLARLATEYNFSVLVNKSSDVVSIINNLIGQTQYVSTFRHGQFFLIDLMAEAPEWRLGIGRGLRFRMPQQDSETPLTSVFNRFEIRVSRDVYGSTSSTNLPLWRVYRDKNSGPAALRALCAASEARFGVLTYPGAGQAPGLDAADLSAVIDKKTGEPMGSPSAELLGNAMVDCCAFPYQPQAYMVSDEIGLSMDLNHRACLSDPKQNLNETPAHVLQISDTATGTVCTFGVRAVG